MTILDSARRSEADATAASSHWPKALAASRTTTGNGESSVTPARTSRSASGDRALGGADEALFRAVFAVDLTELGSAEAVTRDDVKELLFSASIVGQRRSAARAMSSLHRQRLELARLRQGDALANRLLAELESVRRSLTEASREAAGYPARQVELSRLER